MFNTIYEHQTPHDLQIIKTVFIFGLKTYEIKLLHWEI